MLARTPGKYGSDESFSATKVLIAAIVVEHRNKPQEEMRHSYLQKLATYLEKELLRKREQKKRRLERIAAEM